MLNTSFKYYGKQDTYGDAAFSLWSVIGSVSDNFDKPMPLGVDPTALIY